MTEALVLKTQVTPLNALSRLRKNKSLLKKTFTPKELRYALSKRYPDQSLGARLAAKKAFLSALGPKNRKGLNLAEFEILNDAFGKPHFSWKRNDSRAAKLGIRQIAVSLSHADHYAVASVLVHFGR